MACDGNILIFQGAVGKEVSSRRFAGHLGLPAHSRLARFGKCVYTLKFNTSVCSSNGKRCLKTCSHDEANRQGNRVLSTGGGTSLFFQDHVRHLSKVYWEGLLIKGVPCGVEA